MDFSKVTNIVIPEGRVTQIAEKKTGRILWGNAIAAGVILTAVDASSPVVVKTETTDGTQYRINNGAWTHYDTVTTLSARKIAIRCVGKTKAHLMNTAGDRTGVQDSSGKFKLSGHIADLLDWKKRLKETITYGESCFASFLSGCTTVTDISELIFPDTVSESMWNEAFRDCTALENGFTKLPAKTLAASCYYGMFFRCTALKKAPEIMAETLAQSCFQKMFQGCTGLESVASTTIHFTQVHNYSLYEMFSGCTALKEGLDLTKIIGVTHETTSMGTIPGQAAFQSMYEGCSNLTSATLPETFELCNGNYKSSAMFYTMFKDCTSLVTAPPFPKCTLSTGTTASCSTIFYGMYNGCKALKTLPTLAQYPTHVRGGADQLFRETFKGCTSITEVPDGYFNAITSAGADFRSTFEGCTGLTKIGKIFNSSMTAYTKIDMEYMFKDCKSLASMPTEDWLLNYTYGSDFVSMFENCSSLKTVQGITLVSQNETNSTGNFTAMFKGCTSLTSATFTTSLLYGVFDEMFANDTALTTVTMDMSKLAWSSTSSTTHFKQMFNFCKSLKEIPFVLPSTVKTLAASDCNAMFGTCTSLTKVPNDFFGGVTEVGSNCCESMFSGCTALTDVPLDLVANITTLASQCFKFMFYGTGCRIPIDLPATTLANNCYDSMYVNCTSMYASATETGYYVYAWRVPSDEDTTSTATTPTLNMFSSIGGGLSKWTGSPTLNTTYYFLQNTYVKLESDSGTAMTFNSASAASLTYSLDNTTYQTVAANTDISCPKGVIYLKGSSGVATRVGTDSTGSDNNVSGVFKVTCSANDVKVSGDARALVKADSFGSISSFSATYMFGNLFRNQTAIKDISKFVVGATGNESCYSMFRNCDNLTKVSAHLLPCDNVATCAYEDMLAYNSGLTELPKNFLPATTAASGAYQYMFQNCPNLKKLPNINITELGYRVCHYMFYSCTAVEELEDGMFDAITQITCNDGMEYMFQACTGLKKVSAKFTNLTYIARGGCYYMFSGCTALESVPTDMFPVLTTVGYGGMSHMFYYCSKLLNAPNLPATNFTAYDRTDTSATSTRSGYTYESMFQSCSSLKTGPSALPATTLVDYCYLNMFYECFSMESGPTVLPAETAAIYCYQFMYYRNYKMTTAPDISLKTTATGCCFGMFTACTTMTTPPTALYATDLATSSYYSMFTGCIALTRTPQIYVKSATYQNCMAYMFGASSLNGTNWSACTSLKYLNFVYQITTVGVSAMYYMFNGCKVLEDIIDVSSTAPVAGNAMVAAYANTNVHISTTQTGEYNVPVTLPASTSTSPYYNMFASTTGTYTDSTYTAGTTYYMKPASNTFVKLRSRAGTAFTLTNNGNGNLQYSHNGVDWTNMTKSTAVTADFGHLYLRSSSANTGVGGSTQKTSYFKITSSTNDVVLAGYMYNLLNYNGSYSLGKCAFASLFYGNTALCDVSGVVLPSNTNSADYSCQGMFRECSNIVYPCVLPATTVGWGGYEQMFMDDTKLKYPSELPITSITTRSLTEMFSGCTGMKASTTQDSTYTHAWTMPSVGAGGGNATDMMFGVTGFNRIPVNGTTYYFAVA